jgi:mannosyltransferase
VPDILTIIFGTQHQAAPTGDHGLPGPASRNSSFHHRHDVHSASQHRTRPLAAHRSVQISATIVVTPPSAERKSGWWTVVSRHRLTPVVALLIVIGVGLVLRLRDVGVRSLWVDELFSVGLAAQSPSTILTVLYGEEANMALYYALMFVWVRIFGADSNETVMRLPSVLFGVAGLWALYRLGARLDRPLTGLVAAVLMAVNAYHIEMSQEARAYTMWAMLVTLSWDALIDALDSGRRGAWLRSVAGAPAAFYSRFCTLFVTAARVLVVAMRARVSEWRVLVACGVLVAALCTPFLPFFVVNSDGSQILHVRPSGPGQVYDLFKLFAGASTPLIVAYSLLGLIGCAVAVWRTIGARDRSGVGRALAPLLWLLVPVLTIFLLSYVKPMFKERYLFAAMPAFPLLAAIGLMSLRPVLARPLLVVGLAALAMVPLLSGLEIRQSENWRGATAYLDESIQPGDGAIFISKRGQLGYEYYGNWLSGTRNRSTRPDILEPFSWEDLASSQDYYRGLTAAGSAQFPALAAGHPRIWLVISHEFDSTFGGDTSELVRTVLTRRGYSARQRTFQNVRVLLYERRL